MLLLHQAGSVKIGEVVRYTVTYTPAHDRILPSPPNLYLKIKNTSAIALRAAFVHGPYTLYTAAYPAAFQANAKFEKPGIHGVPEFEPNLKAGGTFSTALAVPEAIRATAGQADGHGRNLGREEDVRSVSWIVEVTSQVIFSNSAAVHYEILLARDEKGLSVGFASQLTGHGGVGTAPAPGQLSDHQQSQGAKDGSHAAQPKGVYSKAVRVRVDDTASLWNTPRMPEWDDRGKERGEEKNSDAPVEKVMGNEHEEQQDEGHRNKRQKKVHLVVLTHGLHSNLGADMLYLKESIDASAKQAKIDARARRAKKGEKERGRKREQTQDEPSREGEAPKATEQQEDLPELEDEDEEEVIVRGFSGNAVRTERGIKYLGKRLAKYVLAMTYPDQPFRPTTKKSAAEALSHALKPESSSHGQPSTSGAAGAPSHNHSTILKQPYEDKNLAYKITSISFIAHSLGGLIQTYAIAYIQKHSPEFFDRIQPINFIALASPFLGLSNENPLYVKFALDFGLVGRTGQDLGLTWRAPTIARSGWGAIVGGIGESAHKRIDGETAPEAKPLLRILPTGPAHTVLKKFRHRTVYSNVVNDGVVPLRTSCLLFLDWQGLGRVEKARRENGLVGTMASWGWAELTGQNSGSPARRNFSETFSEGSASDSEEKKDGDGTPMSDGRGADVPQPSPYATQDDNRSIRSVGRRRSTIGSDGGSDVPVQSPTSDSGGDNGPMATFLNFFKPNTTPKSPSYGPKHTKIYKRSQTLRFDDNSSASSSTPKLTKTPSSPRKAQGKASTGDSEYEDPQSLSAPPKTTFFESAGDIIKPPIPSVDFLIDPEKRPRTIFHDRVYHPEDIPPPPLKKRPTGSLMLRRRSSATATQVSTSSAGSDPFPKPPSHQDSIGSTKDYDDTKHTNPGKDPRDVVDGSAMKVEEKIARAYHRDLSWRKVLVRLEPDAHNNMIVRRMFANAYGWPVIKHLCDTHFSDAAVATTRDEQESNRERAKDEHEKTGKEGGETKDDEEIKNLGGQGRTDSEAREAKDHVPQLPYSPTAASKPNSLAKALAGTNLGILGDKAAGKRPVTDRGGESGTDWSDRDWADSELDTEDEMYLKEETDRRKSTQDDAKDKSKRASGGWDWREVIAGKGLASPKGTDPKDVSTFLGKGSVTDSPLGLSPENEVDKQLGTDAASAERVLGGEGSEVAGTGVGLDALGVASEEGRKIGEEELAG